MNGKNSLEESSVSEIDCVNFEMKFEKLKPKFSDGKGFIWEEKKNACFLSAENKVESTSWEEVTKKYYALIKTIHPGNGGQDPDYPELNLLMRIWKNIKESGFRKPLSRVDATSFSFRR